SLLDVDDELGVLVGGGNGRNPGLGVVLLGVHGVAAGGDNLHRLQGFTVHDYVLGRPVGAGNGVLVLISLVFGGFHRAGLGADLDLGNIFRLRHIEIDHIDLGVAANYEQVAAGTGQAGDMHRVAGIYDADNFLGVAVDQCHLATVPQGDGEQIGEVELALGL